MNWFYSGRDRRPELLQHPACTCMVANVCLQSRPCRHRKRRTCSPEAPMPHLPARSSTYSPRPSRSTPTRRRSTTGTPHSPTASSPAQFAELRTSSPPGGRRLRATGSASGSRRAPSSSTSRSSARCAVGAAYVPVDHDDPDERARLVFDEARRRGRAGADAEIDRRAPRAAERTAARAAGARGRRVDHLHVGLDRRAQRRGGHATARRRPSSTRRRELFLRERPLGPGDRVLAGLSVAFDASCEEMWLAWRNGACLVPAPRALVRSGIDLGPWLVDQQITAISTVPTLASLWPAEALSKVRLLIFGGEACPPELADRLAIDGPRGVEHLRPDRDHRRRVRRAPRRSGSGADRPAAGGVGPRGRRSRRGSRSPRASRRADHRRCRASLAISTRRRTPRSSPRSRRSAGTAPTAAVTSCVSSRPGCCSSGAPTTRSSSADDGSSWARSTARCSRCRASPAPRPRCGRPARATRCWSAISRPAPGVRARSARRAAPAARGAAGRPRAAARRGRRDPGPHVGQGRPGRPALAGARARAGARTGHPLHRNGRVAGAAVDRGARVARGQPRRRLLRTRRRQPVGGPARVDAARALPRGRPSPTSTRTRGSAHWPTPWTSSRRPSARSTARSHRLHAARGWCRSSRSCRWPP